MEIKLGQNFTPSIRPLLLQLPIFSPFTPKHQKKSACVRGSLFCDGKKTQKI
jgi:hypothetical protein